jgi:hypothetical protein
VAGLAKFRIFSNPSIQREQQSVVPELPIRGGFSQHFYRTCRTKFGTSHNADLLHRVGLWQ